jgi:hypothetical protein
LLAVSPRHLLAWLQPPPPSRAEQLQLMQVQSSPLRWEVVLQEARDLGESIVVFDQRISRNVCCATLSNFTSVSPALLTLLPRFFLSFPLK